MITDQLRITRIRDLMKQRQLDAFLCQLPENVVFFSGWWPMTGVSWVVFTSRGEVHLVVPACEAEEAGSSGAAVSTFEYAHLSAGDPTREMVSLIGTFFKKEGIDKGRTGIEGIAESLAPPLNIAEPALPGERFWSLLRDVLPRVDWVDASGAINTLRSVKTPAEVERFRIANEIAGFGLEAFQREVRPGISAIELAMEVNKAIAIKGSGYKGIRSARGFAQISSGEGTQRAWRPCVVTDNRKLVKGDTVLLELAAVADGCWADNTRCAVAGGASREQKRIYGIVLRAQQAAREAVRPGVLMSQVDTVAREIIEDAGYGRYFFHITGHGVGWRYHEFPPLLAPGNDTPLEEGMVTSVEPGVYIPGIGGFRVEDNVAVGKDGCDTLSTFSRELL